jgi:hypothetical protein
LTTQADQRVHHPHGDTSQVLGALAECGDGFCRSADTEHLGCGHAQGCTRGEARSDRKVGVDRHRATGVGPGRGDHRSDQSRPRGLQRRQGGAVSRQIHRKPDGRPERRRGDRDVRIRRGGELDGDAELDGHGEGQTLVVVGVVTNEVDPSGPCRPSDLGHQRTSPNVLTNGRYFEVPTGPRGAPLGHRGGCI